MSNKILLFLFLLLSILLLINFFYEDSLASDLNLTLIMGLTVVGGILIFRKIKKEK